MVRVIGQDPEIERQTSCGECGARIAYLPNEVISEQHYDYSGSKDTYKHVVCPQCRKNVDVTYDFLRGRLS